MNDVIDRDSPRDPKQPLTLAEYLQELDVSGWPRHLKLIGVAVAVLLLLMGLNWARTFYTDWLWFSNLGYQQVLLKIVTTKVWLFLAGDSCLQPLPGPTFIWYSVLLGDRRRWRKARSPPPSMEQ